MSKILAPHAMTPLDPMRPFHARHLHARLSGISVNYIEYRTVVNIGADLSRRFYLIHLVLKGECRLGEGHDEQTVKPSQIAVINPAEPSTVRPSNGCGQICVSPKSCLKSVRLDRLRTEPLDQASKNRSVSDIAREYGSRHMGIFARDYDKRFGEKPSETRQLGSTAQR